MLDKPREEQAQVNQIIKAECRSCDRITNHLILACFEQLEHEYVDGATENELCRYQIAQCKGCDLLALLLEVWTPHGEIIQPFEGSDISSYPPSASKSAEATDNLRKPLPPNEVKMLPDNLRRIYRETLAAFNASLPVLTGIGIRAILEMIVQEENLSGSNLEEKVDNLGGANEVGDVHDAENAYGQAISEVKATAANVSSSSEDKKVKGVVVEEKQKGVRAAKNLLGNRKGLLADKQIQILHKFRIMGNSAVHGVKPHSLDELHVALTILEGLLQMLYIFPQKAEYLFVE